MKFSTRAINAYRGFISSGIQKNELTGRQLSDNFLQYGNRNKPLLQQWSPVEMSDKDMYTGYSYAAIQKRANRASALGKKFLFTEASQTIVDTAKKKDVDIVHPYLELVRNSKEFSQRKFWHDISTYLDLEGVYYLMAVRAIGQNPDGTTKVGEIQKFSMLNPYEIRKVYKDSTREFGGYVETHNGLYREIPKEMIIEIRLLNPFDNDLPYSMTDAAKESQFTIKQSGDYTRHAIKGNINAPGAISTDVILEDAIFDNFVSRIQNHAKGEPLYGNGTGAINWQSMQIDLDKAALDKINEIHRSVLFSVAGVSDMLMGQQKAGTGREVSKTQKDEFTENAVMPQIEDIIDALNLDYRQWYPEWEKDKYEICLDNPLETDREAELKDIEIREAQYDLTEKLVNQGYERSLASKYASGEITIEELGEPTLEEELTIEQADELVAREAGFNPNPQKETAEDELENEASANHVAINKFVPIEQNEKLLKDARKRLKGKIKAEKDAEKIRKQAEKEAKKTKKKEEPVVAPETPVVEPSAETPTLKIEVTAPQNAIRDSFKFLNQVAAKDYPGLYDGIDIDFSKLGCIMINTTKIPVTQYVENGEDDIYDDGGRHTAVVGETEPHVTLLFGLLENGNTWKDKVDQVLEGWKAPVVTINEVSYFELEDSYAIIGLVEKSEELIDGHERLTLLPHVNTFSEYTPHITLAYIKKDVDPDTWVKPLNKRYRGQKVRTTGINYGDLPEDNANNHVDDEHKTVSTATPKKKDNSLVLEASQTHVEALHGHFCHEHDNDINSTLEVAKNALEPDMRDKVQLTEAELLAVAQQIELEMTNAYISAVQNGDYNEAQDILTARQTENFTRDLATALTVYYLVVYPIYGKQIMSVRASEYGQQGIFAMTTELESDIRKQARKSAESHINTVKQDLQKSVVNAVETGTQTQLIKLVEEQAVLQNARVLSKLPTNPNLEDIAKAVQEGKFKDTALYRRARELARQGGGLDEVARNLRKEYDRISVNRAKTIARHETNRVFNMAQYQADIQFLTESGLMGNAYKIMRSRTGTPCAICEDMIRTTNASPIPFMNNFADLGDTLTASFTKENGTQGTQKLAVNYEPISAGNVHVNCQCEYVLLIQQEDGTFLNSLEAES